MKESQLFGMLGELNKKIQDNGMKNQSRDSAIIQMRLQLNGLIMMMKACRPLRWTIGALYDHFAKKAYAEYTAELVRRNNEAAKMQQAHVEQEKQKKQEIQAKSVKIGRNSKCTCGSGKKYKKCCLGKEKEKKVE